MKNVKYILNTLIITGLISCSQSTYQAVYPTLHDGKYDSELPYKNCSDQLEKISHSIKKISSIVFYKIYTFSSSESITKDQINNTLLEKFSKNSSISSESFNGTGTIIYTDINKIALLTCSHVVHLKDTLYSYFKNTNSDKTYIQSIAIKQEQNIYVPDIAIGEKFNLLAHDSDKDIAIISLESESQNFLSFPKFNYPLGNSKELEWGSFVYIMGYPLGLPMITRGIVSSPQKIAKGTFIIDAVFNHGISGGLVLGVRDGVPNFELVGIAKSASAEYINYIIPHLSNNKMVFNKNLPYKGELNVNVKEIINYGITYSLTVEQLKNFHKSHSDTFFEAGFDFKSFFEN